MALAQRIDQAIQAAVSLDKKAGEREKTVGSPAKIRTMKTPRILMCPPDFYGIEYEINVAAQSKRMGLWAMFSGKGSATVTVRRGCFRFSLDHERGMKEKWHGRKGRFLCHRKPS